MTDPIADLLTRIRNALMRSKETVNAPYSKLKHELAKLLVKEGFLHSVKKVKKDFDELEITLKYFEEELSLIHISEPTRRRGISGGGVGV